MSLPFADIVLTRDRKHGQRQPREVLIRQREYAHDTAVITLPYESKMAAKYRSGAPISITWGWLPNDVNTFYGFVHHPQQVSEVAHPKMLKVFCVGASWRMKQTGTRSFTGRVNDLAATLARAHHFSLLTDSDPAPARLMAQHGRSDFGWLVDEAQRAGMTFYVNRTDLRLLRRETEKVVRAQLAFRFNPKSYKQRGAVYEIKHNVGEDLPGTDRRIRTAYGVDDDGRLIVATNSATLDRLGGSIAPSRPVFSRLHLGHPVRSHIDAHAALAGVAEMNRFHVTAEAVMSGNTGVHQGSTVRVVGLDEDSDGLWYVTGVDHVITMSDYRIYASVGRDSLGDLQADTVTQVSVSGKPVLVSHCDSSMEGVISAAPVSIYTPVDDCTPIETLGTTQLGDTVSISPAFGSPARLVQRARLAGAARERGASSVQTVSRSVPRLNGWRAATHIVRTRT